MEKSEIRLRRALLLILKRILEERGASLLSQATLTFRKVYPERDPTPKRLALLISHAVRSEFNLNPKDTLGFVSVIEGWISATDPSEYWRELLSNGGKRDEDE